MEGVLFGDFFENKTKRLVYFGGLGSPFLFCKHGNTIAI